MSLERKIDNPITLSSPRVENKESHDTLINCPTKFRKTCKPNDFKMEINCISKKLLILIF